jgi:hypothetical protein
VRSEFLGAELAAEPDIAAMVFGDVLGGAVRKVEGGTAYSWPGGGTLLVRPAGEGHPGVRALVFRYPQVFDLAGGRVGEDALYDSPARLLRLDSGAEWPR